MPKRVAVTTLNASTIDILNVIRANATYDYQQAVPVVESATDIPKVGEVIYGTPAFSNQFLNALINRIAAVRVKSATFNNPYAILKKGYIEYGETIEEIFVNIAKVVNFDIEKAPAREFRRTLPDVKSAFHACNWRVMYPITIEDEQLRMAFLSLDGVQDLIARIVDSIYQAAQYDEYLLCKYLLVKNISHGKMKPVSIGDGSTLQPAAVQFRGISNLLTFMSNEYNEAGVQNVTPRDRQIIFMDALFNAQFDVDVLSAAFNMDKADFMGRLFLIDNWTTFDNARFEQIREHSDGIEEVTADELALLANVKAVIIDSDWAQIYDNANRFTESYVSSGLYWNYFYHVWKTISYSPFANAVVFVTDDTPTAPASITYEVMSKDTSEEAVTMAILPQFDGAQIGNTSPKLVQSEALVQAGIGVQPYGALLIPASATATEITLEATMDGETYTATETITSATAVGTTVTLNKG